jgi:lambda repressor-like predicted transcriptional regulator
VREQLLANYQAGVSAKQLARRYQLSRSSIRVLLRESGLPQRYPAMTKGEIDQAVELYEAGSTIAEAAAVLGRPCSTIQTALSRRSVAMRGRNGYTR